VGGVHRNIDAVLTAPPVPSSAVVPFRRAEMHDAVEGAGAAAPRKGWRAISLDVPAAASTDLAHLGCHALLVPVRCCRWGCAGGVHPSTTPYEEYCALCKVLSQPGTTP